MSDMSTAVLTDSKIRRGQGSDGPGHTVFEDCNLLNMQFRNIYLYITYLARLWA